MLFAFVHLVTGMVLSSLVVIVALVVPGLAGLGMAIIPIGAVAGFLLAFPVSLLVTRAVREATREGI